MRATVLYHWGRLLCTVLAQISRGPYRERSAHGGVSRWWGVGVNTRPLTITSAVLTRPLARGRHIVSTGKYGPLPFGSSLK